MQLINITAANVAVLVTSEDIHNVAVSIAEMLCSIEQEMYEFDSDDDEIADIIYKNLKSAGHIVFKINNLDDLL